MHLNEIKFFTILSLFTPAAGVFHLSPHLRSTTLQIPHGNSQAGGTWPGGHLLQALAAQACLSPLAVLAFQQFLFDQ